VCGDPLGRRGRPESGRGEGGGAGGGEGAYQYSSIGVDRPPMTSPGAPWRLAADRLGGGEKALLQASLVEHLEQGPPASKKDARRSAA
jgi:hypothetical protein